MNIESLKLFAEIAATLSADAKTMLIWWVSLKSVLPNLLTFTAVIFIAVVVYKLVSKGLAGDFEKYIKDMRDALRVGSPGSLTQAEARETIARVMILIEKEKQSIKGTKNGI